MDGALSQEKLKYKVFGKGQRDQLNNKWVYISGTVAHAGHGTCQIVLK